MKKIKVEWCENFIKSVFEKTPLENGGIEINLFWNKAEKSGLWNWKYGTYKTSMSIALEKLTEVENIYDNNGKFLYEVFKLK